MTITSEKKRDQNVIRTMKMKTHDILSQKHQLSSKYSLFMDDDDYCFMNEIFFLYLMVTYDWFSLEKKIQVVSDSKPIILFQFLRNFHHHHHHHNPGYLSFG